MTALGEKIVAGLRPPPERRWHRQARPEQLPPEGTWSTWLILTGRGWGKTRAGSEWTLEGALTHSGTVWGVVAPTFRDCRMVCLEGESGILKVAQRGEVAHYVRSFGEVVLRNGSKILSLPAGEPERIRGHNLAGVWVDELAVCEYPDRLWHEALGPAVRVAPAKIVVTTTPRPIPLLRELVNRIDGSVHITRGSTFENRTHWPKARLAELEARYEGTRLGRQELLGELLEDVEGALWSLSMIDVARVSEPPELDRIVVAVDPAVTAGEHSDQTGIVVAGIVGRRQEAQFFVLEDASLKASPERWANRVKAMYDKWAADRVIAERNQGGDLVERTLRQVAPNLPVRTVHAHQGKQLRAEPVSALYEQGRVHHVGVHAELEEQLTTWVPGVARSPDRLDALVYALTELAEHIGSGRFVHVGPAESLKGSWDPQIVARDPTVASRWRTGPSTRNVAGLS